MKSARSFMIHTSALCVTLTLLGCGSAPEPTAPFELSDPANPAANPPQKPASLIATSTLTQAGWAGFGAAYSPTVEVRDQNGRPLGDVTVIFAVAQGGGLVSNASTTTDQWGFAGTGWTLGDQAGTNTVVASVKDLAPIYFHADVKVPAIIARYDLVEVGGKPLAQSWYSEGGVTAAHYFLSSDGTFAFGYVINGLSGVHPVGTTVWADPTTLKFYQWPGSYPRSQFYTERNGLFATGRIEGNTMTVTYEDWIDFDTEKYVLSAN